MSSFNIHPGVTDDMVTIGRDIVLDRQHKPLILPSLSTDSVIHYNHKAGIHGSYFPLILS